MDLVVLAGARRRLPDKILNSGQGLLATALDSEDATDTSARTAVPMCRACAPPGADAVRWTDRPHTSLWSARRPCQLLMRPVQYCT